MALDIPRLPSLNEQRRITDILDKADALRAKRREAIALLDALGQSIFNQMFIGDFRQTATLGEILKVSSGKFLPAKSMTEGGHYPVYGGNGITGFHDQYVVEEATLVIGRVGANCGAVHLTRPKSWITDNALRVKKLLPLVDEYLLFALRQADLNQYANVSGQPSISGASIYRVPVSVPAFELQQKFANRVAAVELLKTKHRLQLAELDNLFLSLQDRAFKGEL
ncbi:restriction endonuclease subunit S [Glutamicibacter arilaitensis]|uniref:restriction endonuclease subunit S n=1 Tax=Glutamicibacter arilaitensis TaxID=256701 RepID=UPI0018684176|nr:restriction endonuclease subunit S [Glutamicibacter arilaitensis]